MPDLVDPAASLAILQGATAVTSEAPASLWSQVRPLSWTNARFHMAGLGARIGIGARLPASAMDGLQGVLLAIGGPLYRPVGPLVAQVGAAWVDVDLITGHAFEFGVSVPVDDGFALQRALRSLGVDAADEAVIASDLQAGWVPQALGLLATGPGGPGVTVSLTGPSDPADPLTDGLVTLRRLLGGTRVWRARSGLADQPLFDWLSRADLGRPAVRRIAVAHGALEVTGPAMMTWEGHDPQATATLRWDVPRGRFRGG